MGHACGRVIIHESEKHLKNASTVEELAKATQAQKNWKLLINSIAKMHETVVDSSKDDKTQEPKEICSKK